MASAPVEKEGKAACRRDSDDLVRVTATSEPKAFLGSVAALGGRGSCLSRRAGSSL